MSSCGNEGSTADLILRLKDEIERRQQIAKDACTLEDSLEALCRRQRHRAEWWPRPTLEFLERVLTALEAIP